MGGGQSVPAEAAAPGERAPRRAPISHWRVSFEARGFLPPASSGAPRRWLKLTPAGASVVRAPDGAGPPCVMVVPENGSPEESERLSAMPRFRIASAGGLYLTGPHRSAAAGGGVPPPEAGRAATSAADDQRDFLEAYPAPTAGGLDPSVCNVYVWSPSRACALAADADGRLSWRPAPPAALLNFGTSPVATVWAVRIAGPR